MNHIRRALVAALVICIARPLAALAAWNKEAFGAKTAGDALKSLGIGNATASDDLKVEVPQIAENGAVVPIEISSAIPGTTALIVVIDKNRIPIVTRVALTPASGQAYMGANIRLGETTDVRAVIEQSDGTLLAVKREVKVTVGGCGG